MVEVKVLPLLVEVANTLPKFTTDSPGTCSLRSISVTLYPVTDQDKTASSGVYLLIVDTSISNSIWGAGLSRVFS